MHGYTGYILGAVHAVPLFHTPDYANFVFSFSYGFWNWIINYLVTNFSKFFTDFRRIDYEMMQRLARLLAWFIVIDLVIRFFWLTFAITFNNEEKYALKLFLEKIYGKLFL